MERTSTLSETITMISTGSITSNHTIANFHIPAELPHCPILTFLSPSPTLRALPILMYFLPNVLLGGFNHFIVVAQFIAELVGLRATLLAYVDVHVLTGMADDVQLFAHLVTKDVVGIDLIGSCQACGRDMRGDLWTRKGEASNMPQI